MPTKVINRFNEDIFVLDEAEPNSTFERTREGVIKGLEDDSKGKTWVASKTNDSVVKNGSEVDVVLNFMVLVMVEVGSESGTGVGSSLDVDVETNRLLIGSKEVEGVVSRLVSVEVEVVNPEDGVEGAKESVEVSLVEVVYSWDSTKLDSIENGTKSVQVVSVVVVVVYSGDGAKVGI